MNHCYRLIWNQIRHCFVVAAEITRGRGKSGSSQRSVLKGQRAWLLAAPLALVPLLGMATGPTGVGTQAMSHAAVGPAGGSVTAGSGTIRQDGLTTTIEQHSQNLSLNWQSFNVGAASTVNFAQPNAQSIAVNRIAGSNGSVILGHLNANGQVFLINPNGMLFGPSAQVHVGGLVASTLDMGDGELEGGTRHFLGGGGGSVINQGNLRAKEGGYIALIGPQVTNQGTLSTPGGTVAMGGGNAVTLSFDTNRLLSLQVDQSTLNALADNRQLIMANGGQVLMSAGAKDALLRSVVNNSGVIQARTVANHDGRIVLLGGMAAGTTQVAGTLDASAPTSGDGGFIETSAAHVTVADGTKITTLATTGKTGTWLIDPHDYTIAASGGDMTGTALSTNLGTSDVSLQSASGATAGNGNINVNDAVSWSANTKLTLTASNDVNINANITATGASAGLGLAPKTANGADVASGSGQYRLADGAVITLSGAAPSLSIAGTPYTVINSLGAPGSTTGADLQGMNVSRTGTYALGSDIDASPTAAWNRGAGFTPIGYYGNSFIGIFDGLGHTITGLTINRPSTNNVGLFGYLSSGGFIHNVGLINATVGGAGWVGSLAGISYGGTINRAYATGTVNGTGGAIGGLVGQNYGSLTEAYANVQVGGVGQVGRLVGLSAGTLNQAFATGAVHGSASVGGLIGQNTSSTPVTRVYATGVVSGSSNVGGLIGTTSGYVTQSYATGAVGGSSNVGGLVGSNTGSGMAGRVTQSYATGAVSGSSNVGGLIGSNAGTGSVNVSYWDTQGSGQPTSAGGSGLTTAQMKTASSFTGWDLASNGGSASVWRIYPGQTAPLLRTFMAGLSVTASNVTASYNGTAFGGSSAYTLGSVTPSFWLRSATANPALVLGTINTATPAINAGSYALNTGLYSSQLGYDIALTAGTLTINPAALTYAANATTTTYGTAASGLTGSILGFVNGDTQATATSGTLAWATPATVNSNVGSYAINGRGLAANNGNYTFTQTAGNATSLTINPAVLTVTAADASKTYDALAYSGGNGASYTGFVNGESSTALGGTLAYSGTAQGARNAGSYVLTPGGLVSTNYAVNFASGTLAIDPAALTISTSDVNKVYDGTTIAQGKPMTTTGTLFGTDSLSGGTYAFDTKDVGTNKTVSVAAVSVNDGNSGANYDVTYVPNTHSSISAKPIAIVPIAKVSGIGAANKVYDGTTSATLNLGSALFNGMASGDSLAVGSAMGVFSDKNAGLGKTVFISSITLGGSDATNYTLLDTTATTTANITPLGILVTASGGTKVYDGTTTAPVRLAGSGVLAGDSASFSGNSQFADKNVGTAKPVTVSAITATGADAGNYTTNTSTSSMADITPATLTYQATQRSAAPGWVSNALTGTVTGLVGGDSIATATTGTLTWSTPATASSPAGTYAIDGAGLATTNYLFEQAASNATALQLSTGSVSTAVSPQVLGAIMAQLQQTPRSAPWNTQQDDSITCIQPFATLCSVPAGLPIPQVRIINGGVRLR